jgi:hypothetical protein
LGLIEPIPADPFFYIRVLHPYLRGSPLAIPDRLRFTIAPHPESSFHASPTLLRKPIRIMPPLRGFSNTL